MKTSVETYTEDIGDRLHIVKIELPSLGNIKHRLRVVIDEVFFCFKAWQVYIEGSWITYKQTLGTSMYYHNAVIDNYLQGVDLNT
jgi:hypothetical protein